MSVHRAQALFDDIEGRYAAGETDFRAETSVYNALINCMWGISYCIILYFTALLIVIKLFICPIAVGWAKSGDRTALYHVTQILSLMEELGLKGGDSDVQPNSRTYCSVLDTLARSKNFKAYNKSLEILQRMEGRIWLILLYCLFYALCIGVPTLTWSLCGNRLSFRRIWFGETLHESLFHSLVHHCSQP